MHFSKCKVDNYGNKYWHNKQGQLHREDGPAVEWSHGSKAWYLNGKFHREDGPATEWANGGKSWFRNGQLHRVDGPAIDWAGGYKAWYQNGKRHRVDGPAVEWDHGGKEWWVEGKPLTEEEFKGRFNKSTCKVDGYGNKFWCNERGQLHREDGPAVEWANGSKSWFRNGQLHRVDGPAREWSDGAKFWYQNGKRHRIDGPAREYANGYKEWHIEGEQLTEEEFNSRLNKPTCEINKYGNKYWRNEQDQFHREDGPAVEWVNGDKEWYLNDQLHREDGPAIEWANGSKFWYQNGRLHRVDGPALEFASGYKEWWVNGQYHRIDGPAVECSNGDKFWYQNGKRHRIDGPAIERADGRKEWWLNGKQLSEKQFNERFSDCRCRTDQFGKYWYNKQDELHRLDGPAVEQFDGHKEWWVNGARHREDGPAIEYTGGAKAWYRNSIVHRENGPAVEWADGTKIWYKYGQYHRLDGPAVEHPLGSKEWWVEGKQLTEEEFNSSYGTSTCKVDKYGNRLVNFLLSLDPPPIIQAVVGCLILVCISWLIYPSNDITSNTTKPNNEEYLIPLKLDRMEYSDGAITWHLNSNRHRINGPACEWANGDKEWWANGQLHREDGPAIECANGRKEWWVNGLLHRTDGPAVEHADGRKEWWVNGEYISEEKFRRRIYFLTSYVANPLEIRYLNSGILFKLKSLTGGLLVTGSLQWGYNNRLIDFNMETKSQFE